MALGRCGTGWRLRASDEKKGEARDLAGSKTVGWQSQPPLVASYFRAVDYDRSLEISASQPSWRRPAP